MSHTIDVTASTRPSRLADTLPPLLGSEPLTGALAADLPTPAEVWRWRLAGQDVALAVPAPTAIDESFPGGPNPYWALVWEPALLLADLVLRQPPWRQHSAISDQANVVELGCGLGLPGVAAALAGAHVTFVDRAAGALAFVRVSLALNGVSPDSARFYAGGWGRLPAGPPFAVALGSEIVYERRNLPGRLHFLRRRLADGGRAYITAEDRPTTRRFVDLVQSAELVRPDLTISDRHDFSLPAHPDTEAMLLVLTRRDSA